MVAALVADPDAFSLTSMGAWARDLDSWDVTDMVADTFAATPHADRAIRTWSTARHGFHETVRVLDARAPRGRSS
jgi:3-methyladenine DNA glycosylase AlkD